MIDTPELDALEAALAKATQRPWIAATAISSVCGAPIVASSGVG